MPTELLKTCDDSSLIQELLLRLGEDPTRGGLIETPERFFKAMRFYCRGYGFEPESVLKCFDDGAENYDESVTEKRIPFYSLCEHHLAPFFGNVTISYVPSGKIVGLSKLTRLTEGLAARLQVQERLTTQIADTLDKYLKPKGVAVLIEARHMCKEMRGVRTHGSTTETCALRGVFLNKPEARAEFLSLARNGK